MSSVSVSSPDVRANLVELGRFGRPEREPSGFHGEGSAAVRIRLYGDLGARLGNVDGHRRSGGCAENVDIAGQFRVARLPHGAMRQMHVVVVDEGVGDGDERDVAGEAAVVEPVVAN